MYVFFGGFKLAPQSRLRSFWRPPTEDEAEDIGDDAPWDRQTGELAPDEAPVDADVADLDLAFNIQ